MKRHGIIHNAAAVSLAGMDPMRFLTSTDPVEVLAMAAVAERVSELHAEANKG